MKAKKNRKKVLKYVMIVLSILPAIGLLILLFNVLIIFGVIKDYKYLKINDNNREKMTLLLKSEKPDMFNISNGFDLEVCAKSMKKIELEFLFPDGEEYLIYCNGSKYNFSLDNTNYDLANYISKNGKQGYRLRLKR